MKRKSKAGACGDQIRADRLVKQMLPGLSGRQIEEALEALLIVDFKGKRVKKGDYLEGSRSLDFRPLQAHLQRLSEGNPELEIPVVVDRPKFLVIDKPPGIPSHPLSLFDFGTVTQWAFARYPETRNTFSEIQPTIAPHRLDTGTSGLLIVAKDPDSFERWRECFRKKQVQKKYLAWCWGSASETEWETRAPIGHDLRDRRKMVTAEAGVSYAKPLLDACTRVRLRKQRDEVFLAEVSCETGVTHQVRVHLASRGYPLVGDVLYDLQFDQRSFRPPYHLLRAYALSAPDLAITADTTAFTALFPQG